MTDVDRPKIKLKKLDPIFNLITVGFQFKTKGLKNNEIDLRKLTLHIRDAALYVKKTTDKKNMFGNISMLIPEEVIGATVTMWRTGSVILMIKTKMWSSRKCRTKYLKVARRVQMVISAAHERAMGEPLTLKDTVHINSIHASVPLPAVDLDQLSPRLQRTGVFMKDNHEDRTVQHSFTFVARGSGVNVRLTGGGDSPVAMSLMGCKSFETVDEIHDHVFKAVKQVKQNSRQQQLRMTVSAPVMKAEETEGMMGETWPKMESHFDTM